MTGTIAWLDLPERDGAAATRLHEAALRAGLAPDRAVRLARRLLAAPTGTPPAFARRWRRAVPRPQLQAAA